MSTREERLVTALARARGVSERVIRVEFGVPEVRYVCPECHTVWDNFPSYDNCCRDSDYRD